MSDVPIQTYLPVRDEACSVFYYDSYKDSGDNFKKEYDGNIYVIGQGLKNTETGQELKGFKDFSSEDSYIKIEPIRCLPDYGSSVVKNDVNVCSWILPVGATDVLVEYEAPLTREMCRGAAFYAMLHTPMEIHRKSGTSREMTEQCCEATFKVMDKLAGYHKLTNSSYIDPILVSLVPNRVTPVTDIHQGYYVASEFQYIKAEDLAGDRYLYIAPGCMSLLTFDVRKGFRFKIKGVTVSTTSVAGGGAATGELAGEKVNGEARFPMAYTAQATLEVFPMDCDRNVYSLMDYDTYGNNTLVRRSSVRINGSEVGGSISQDTGEITLKSYVPREVQTMDCALLWYPFIGGTDIKLEYEMPELPQPGLSVPGVKAFTAGVTNLDAETPAAERWYTMGMYMEVPVSHEKDDVWGEVPATGGTIPRLVEYEVYLPDNQAPTIIWSGRSWLTAASLYTPATPCTALRG